MTVKIYSKAEYIFKSELTKSCEARLGQRYMVTQAGGQAEGQGE